MIPNHLKGIIVSWIPVFLLISGAAMAIEKAPYSVIEKDGNIEIREYPAIIVAETTVAGNFSTVGNEGFRRLAAYINGNNRARASIAMTAPVNQEAGSEKIAMTAPVGQEKKDANWRITFVMPSRYSLQALPEPLDGSVRLTKEPARRVAAIRYSGTWSQDRYRAHLAKLMKFIGRRSLTAVGNPVWARYDPPFMPWFLRRNEGLVTLEP